MMLLSSKETMRPDRSEELRALLERHILILDGAMGTTIQGYKLSETDFRGERFTQFPRDLKGNNDLLSLTRPRVIRQIHDQYLDRKSTRLNSSHSQISYAVFCLKKKNK